MPNARKMTDATKKPPPPSPQKEKGDDNASASSQYRSLFSIHGSPLAECKAWLDSNHGGTLSVSKKAEWTLTFIHAYKQSHDEKSLRLEMKQRGCPIPRVTKQAAEGVGRAFVLLAAYFDWMLEQRNITTAFDKETVEKPRWVGVHDLVDAR